MKQEDIYPSERNTFTHLQLLLALEKSKTNGFQVVFFFQMYFFQHRSININVGLSTDFQHYQLQGIVQGNYHLSSHCSNKPSDLLAVCGFFRIFPQFFQTL